MRRRYAVGGAVLVLVLVGACSQPDDEPSPPASPAPTAEPTQQSSSADPGTPTSPSSPNATSTSGGGTDADPALVEATEDLLDWKPVPGSLDDSVTSNGTTTLRVSANRRTWSLDGPTTSAGASGRGSVSDALLDDDWALVVVQPRSEGPPATATVTDLASGRGFRLTGGSEPATVGGGTWSLGQGHLLHATRDKFDAYCLASVDLTSKVGSRRYCAPARHGINQSRIGPGGDTFTGFDAKQPACRTAYQLTEDGAKALTGITPCKAWESLLLGTPDAPEPVWSVVPKDNQIENARLYARTDAGTFDLGPGTSGTLTACGSAAYFVRDPQREGDPAALLRWDGEALTVVYQSPSGQAFLSAPRCGGSVLTVSAFAEGGDEQVSAPVLP